MTILLPEFLRRATVLAVIAGLLLATLAPGAVGSAATPSRETQRLLTALAADEPLMGGDRGAEATFSTRSGLGGGGGVEDVGGQWLLAPPVATMTATPQGITAALVARPGGGSSISGKASWYCCSRGWTGVAVVALPTALGGHYDAPPASTWVTICAQRCARLPVVDSCGCHFGTESQKVADLSPEAWAAITDRDRYVYGVVMVTVYFDT